MKLLSISRFLIVISALALFVLGGATYHTIKRTQVSSHAVGETYKIVAKVIRLRTLLADYLLFHSERSREQWWVMYDDVSRSLAQLEMQTVPQKRVMGEIGQMLGSIKDIFERIQDNDVTLRSSKTNSDSYLELRTYLSNALVLQTGDLQAANIRLVEIARGENIRYQQQIFMLSMFLWLVLGGIIIYYTFLLRRRVVGPLARMQAGVRKVGLGQLDHKIVLGTQDEINALAQAFNEMASNLKTSMTSIEALNREISDRVQVEAWLKASETRFRNLFENSLNAVALHQIVLDDRGTPVDYVFLEVNAAFEKHTGLRREDVVGKRVTQVLPGITRTDFIQIYGEVAVSGRPVSFEAFDALLKRHFSIAAYPFGAGCFAVVFDDISSRKKAEDAIRQLNQELEDRVRQRTVELERANKELEAFSYSVSHDLRAPLRSMEGFSHILMEDWADKLDARGKDYLQRVCTATAVMGQLIDDMLDLSRVGRKEMQVVSVDLSLIARKICSEFHDASPERAVEFKIQDNVRATGDEGLLQIVMQNLLENAWKFTGKHERAVIEFGAWIIEGKRTYFVRDDGDGFDMAYAQKLFGVFQRLHSKSDFPGTGIGLSIVNRIITRHGGRVWIESAGKDKGATVGFSLA